MKILLPLSILLSRGMIPILFIWLFLTLEALICKFLLYSFISIQIKLFGFYDTVKAKNIQSFEAVAHHVVDDVGGLQVDEYIANILADGFKKKHNVLHKIISVGSQR